MALVMDEDSAEVMAEDLVGVMALDMVEATDTVVTPHGVPDSPGYKDGGGQTRTIRERIHIHLHLLETLRGVTLRNR